MPGRYGTEDDELEPAPLSSGTLRERIAAGVPRVGELGRLLALARPHLLLIFAAMLLTGAITGISLAIPWVLGSLVDNVLVQRSVESLPAGADRLAPLMDRLLGLSSASASVRLNRLAMFLLALAVARAVMTSMQALAVTVAGERAVLDLRDRLYAHLLTLGPSFYDKRRTGAMVSRVINDVAQIQAAVTSDLAGFSATALTLVGALVVLILRSWKLTLLILVMVPPVVALGRKYGRSMRTYGRLYQDRLADASSIAEETLGAIRVVQSFTQEGREHRRFDEALRRLYAIAVQRASGMAFYSAGVATLSYSALAAAVWFGGHEVVAGHLTAGDVVVFGAYAGMVASSAANLVGLYARWANALGASRRVFSLLDERPAITDGPRARALGHVQGRLTLDDVQFGYEPGRIVLHNIALDIAPGEKLALVGPSGAGKSTLLHLIARFYDPTSGRLLIDGVDLRDVTLASLRSRIAIVAQEPALFNASVADNLRYGRPAASDAEIRAAASAACAAEFVAQMPQGYDTVLGDRAVRLSTGEKQRLAIARALLRDPALLLLDEATSSLDNESERLVQAALERLTEGRTSIVIAHRLSTVHDADRIAVLDQGRIVELGKHEALLAHNGLYARLYRLHLRLGEPATSLSGWGGEPT
jgi:subfamily B ATP-binding cassette protein MsbA